MPAPTLGWLLLAQPASIARDDVLHALSPLVDDSAWQRFEERNGFDLRATPEALIAGFELGTLFLWRSDANEELIEQRFRERLLRDDQLSRPHPRLTRQRGLVGQTPQALLRARGQFVALAVEDPTLLRLVEGYLLKRFQKTPSALRGAALRNLADFGEEAPLRLFMPALLDGERTFPAPFPHLSGAEALAVAASFPEANPNDETSLLLHVAVTGPWNPSEVTPQPLRDAWDGLVTSPAGRLLHLHEPLEGPECQVKHQAEDQTLIELRVRLRLRSLLRGLHRLLAA